MSVCRQVDRRALQKLAAIVSNQKRYNRRLAGNVGQRQPGRQAAGVVECQDVRGEVAHLNRRRGRVTTRTFMRHLHRRTQTAPAYG